MSKKLKSRIALMACTAGIFLLAFFMLPMKETKAAGNYYLQVNKETNVVTVYTNNGVPVRAFVCSVGGATPTGTFYTPAKYRWHTLDGPSYGQYCTRITGSILFHSVFYNVDHNLASMPYSAYNKLGTTASHGCVRLTVADAKWIYDNCPLHTKVIIFHGASSQDPLGKPEAIKVNTGASTGWDPTDPAEGNPYASAMPRIATEGAKAKVEFKSKFSPLSRGVVAYDSVGNDISDKMTCTGKVNTKKLGKYQVTYHITDALGRSASATVTYQVADTKGAVITGVKKKLTKEYNTTMNLRKNVKAKTRTGKSLTKKIKIKVTYPKSKKEKTYKSKKIRFNKLGTYKIHYYVTHPTNKKVTKVTCKVTVRDTKAPVVSGAKSSLSVEYKQKVNLVSGIKAKLRSGKDLTKRVVVKIKAPNSSSYAKLSSSSYKKYVFAQAGTYQVQYTFSNPYNKKATTTKNMTVTVTDTKAPLLTGISASKQVNIGEVLNLKSGVKATLESGQDVSGQIQVTVQDPKGATQALVGNTYTFSQEGSYLIQYTAKNPSSGRSTSQNSKITVLDHRVPAIAIDANKVKMIEANQAYDVYAGVTAAYPDGTAVPNLTATITGESADHTAITQIPAIVDGKVTFTQAGTYQITYMAANPSHPQYKSQQTLTVVVTAQAEAGSDSSSGPNEATDGEAPAQPASLPHEM